MEFALLDLASDSSFDDKPIDVLIGSDLYWQFITGNVIRSSNDLVAVESKFGWILSGAVEGSDSCVDVTHHTALSNLIIEREVGSCDLKHSLRRFWETETISSRETVDEKQLSVDHEKFPINIERDGEHCAVNLPWKSDTEIIASHYNLSKARLGHLQLSLEANDDLMKSYNAVIDE